MSGWKRDGDIHDFRAEWKVGNQQAIVSSYASTNPFEDFAETVTAYRYNGANLKQKFPAKYEYMKNKVFKGLEFDSEANCHNLH